MKTGALFSIVAGITAVSAAAVEKRQTPNIDAVILNYALTLEHLEDTFYRQGLANFTQAQFAAAGYDASFYKNLKEISKDETTHVNFLTTALLAAGASAVSECVYNFPYTDVKSFVSLASVLEGVGVSAYLGAAANITNPAYLTAAGSILTVEARHSAFLRDALALSPFATPFDTPLDFNEVYSLAAPFIVSCPATNAALPVKAFPSLTLTTTGVSTNADITGDYLSFKSASPLAANTAYYLHFLNGLQDISVKAYVSAGNVVSANIPGTIAGQTYVVLTSSASLSNDDNILAGPAIIEIVDCSC
ncbi:Putative uncharacterized protein [Taphrina deformans PYCC 5710]|uniref:Protein rds1 n=1 Tax=Taphrina deformans (strain PYCC 5710 / ATCC 11124 / CBS 356.35 / IMI 108563 / JCM 9778 / NBRC 8474) TaxID=1097556 RepID=R4XHE9_TAPDE|nr:Putative uncharacterized protein [Taphrina deformans PYCC 5710]|eukprot:CCG85187.1 Putative uncharacterized protein [Taphrina deformans PYCC 5710]